MEFGILGPLEVREDGVVLALPGAKQRGLLALLLLHPNEVVPADRIVEELWPDEPPGAGVKSLRVGVSRLRKSLGRGGERLLTRASGYVLELEPGQLDLDRFERLVADAAESEPGAAAATLREALGLWRGKPLADLVYEPFAQAAIARLEEVRLAALERRIEADLALGAHRELVAELTALVAEHPLRERLRAQLMLALYRSDRQAEALDVYRDARRALVDELGLEPSPVLHELEQSILRHDPALRPNDPSAEPLRSIVVAALEEGAVDALLALAEPLASRPSRELVLARPLTPGDDLAAATARLDERRQRQADGGVDTRVAAFTSTAPARDLIRLTTDLQADLLLVDAPPALLADAVLVALLQTSPCDVAVLVARDHHPSDGAVLVAFAGAEHDWTAVEIGAWIARAGGVPLQLAGPVTEAGDASRLLASASLAVQRALGVVAEPLLVEPGPQALVRAAAGASYAVAGLSDRWQREGLGEARAALAADAEPPVLLVCRGLRPGGLAPNASLTRFTWSVRG
jgi:DNA-binding SARP family transcriptional activator